VRSTLSKKIYNKTTDYTYIPIGRGKNVVFLFFSLLLPPSNRHKCTFRPEYPSPEAAPSWHYLWRCVSRYAPPLHSWATISTYIDIILCCAVDNVSSQDVSREDNFSADARFWDEVILLYLLLPGPVYRPRSVNMPDDICMTNTHTHTYVHKSCYYNNNYRARCVHTHANGMSNELVSVRAWKLTCVKPNDSATSS